jgi:hypothetical protein
MKMRCKKKKLKVVDHIGIRNRKEADQSKKRYIEPDLGHISSVYEEILSFRPV